MKQYDVVRITKDIQSEGNNKGQIGTILEVYHNNHFEVEISDENGITLFLGALSGDILKFVK
jgi:translation initiation factor IF-1